MGIKYKYVLTTYGGSLDTSKVNLHFSEIGDVKASEYIIPKIGSIRITNHDMGSGIYDVSDSDSDCNNGIDVKRSQAVIKGGSSLFDRFISFAREGRISYFHNKDELSFAVKVWIANSITARLTYTHISTWDVSEVTDMSFLFYKEEVFDEDISSWDVANVTDMTSMFDGAKKFKQNIGNWNVSSVTDMSYMFYEAESFNQEIGSWNVSSVTNMSSMFNSSISFNQEIGSWNVSRVTDMSYMFYRANSFNQDIGGWVVSSVRSMAYMFSFADSFLPRYIHNRWDINGNVSKKMYYEELGERL